MFLIDDSCMCLGSRCLILNVKYMSLSFSLVPAVPDDSGKARLQISCFSFSLRLSVGYALSIIAPIYKSNFKCAAHWNHGLPERFLRQGLTCR